MAVKNTTTSQGTKETASAKSAKATIKKAPAVKTPVSKPDKDLSAVTKTTASKSKTPPKKESEVDVAKSSTAKKATKVASKLEETHENSEKTVTTKTSKENKVANKEPKPEKSTPTAATRTTKRTNTKVSEKADEKVMVDYSPQIRSVLDAPEKHTGPIYRYSDEELQEFKDLILKRLASARENLTYYQDLMTRKDGQGDDADNRLNSMEDGSGALEKEHLAQMAARQVQFINHLEKALVRIENKTYGICRVTGKLIDKNRLKAVPHATLSMEAKQSLK